MAENFPKSSPIYINSLQQVLSQSITPFALCNVSKSLSREMLHEASAILASPNSMKLFGNLHIFNSFGHANFQLIPSAYVSATSSSPNLAIMALSTASIIFIHPNEQQILRDDHLSA